MASQVLSQQATSDVLYASGGVLTGGSITALNGSVSAVRGFFTQVAIEDDSAAGGDAGLFLFNRPLLPLLPQQYTVTVPSSGTPEGILTVRNRDAAGANLIELASSQIPCRGLVGPPVVNGNQAIWGLTAPSQSGTASLAATTSSVVITNTAVLAGTIVMVTVEGAAPDATATSFSVENQVGASFTIHANAAATADTTLQWFIVHY